MSAMQEENVPEKEIEKEINIGVVPSRRVTDAPVTIVAKIDKATGYKMEGNELVKAGEFAKAISKYNRVFAYTTGLKPKDSQMAQYQKTVGVSPPSDKEEELINSLEVSSWSNLALCHMKLGQPVKVLEDVSKILAREPENGKALYNAGRAYLMLNKLDEAKEALTAASKVFPKDGNIRKELNKLPALLQKEKEKEKATWKKAFNKI